MEVPVNIFRKYDIRGTAVGADAQLTPVVAELIGRAYGTYVQRTFGIKQVFVGGDNRLSTAALQDAIITGLASTGVRVVNIGEVMTPTVYFAAASHEDSGGIMVTGSHLETQYNGIKMAYGRLALAGQQILDLLAMIQAEDFLSGKGEVVKDVTIAQQHMDKIKSMVSMGGRKLKVVVDSGNGLSGSFVPPVMEALGIEVVCLYCEPDGTFPNHLPNPEDPELTKALEAKVIEVGADLGIGFDGDADRCGLIDDHGHHVAADRLIAMLARDLLSRHPGAKIVFDVKASKVLEDQIREHGGEPVMWKSGHSLMKLKMNEIGSLLGGEVSGHIFIGENYYGFDDAPLVALKTLEILSKSQKSISDILNEMPLLLATPEIILSTPDEVKFDIIEDLRAAFADKYPVVTVDGARVQFKNGWGLVRASNTQPAITLRFEANTEAEILDYMQQFDALLAQKPQVDRSKLLTQLASYGA
jgi:phosphomannomutase / phosphoglucomutase